jgi:triosephosphate isomerase
VEKWVIANWKMNGSKSLIDEWAAALPDISRMAAHGVLVPPFTLLDYARRNVPNFIDIGAQDLSPAEKGAYTGDVSAALVKEAGSRIVLIGHSERRQHHNESTELLLKKVQTALAADLIPVLCVGESLDAFEKGETKDVLKSQLERFHPWIKDQTLRLAYEPVWAIGTGRTPTPSIVQEIHSFIEKGWGGKPVYGGSVTVSNAQSFLALESVGGVLIGGESLFPERMSLIFQGKA